MNNAKIAQIAARLTAMGLSPAAANIVANNAPDTTTDDYDKLEDPNEAPADEVIDDGLDCSPETVQRYLDDQAERVRRVEWEDRRFDM